MSRVRRHHSASPYEPIVGYCRAVRVGERVCVGGTAPIEPDGSNTAGDVEAQARRCLQVIREGLEALGATLADVVRTRVYLVDASDWEAVGRVHGELFGAHPPVTAFVVVAGLLDPAWRLEVEAEAVVQDSLP